MSKLLKTLALFTVLALNISKSEAAIPIGQTIGCSAATDVQFVPSWGQVSVNQDAASKYIVQWMYWHDYNRLAWFMANGDSTYEPDAMFDGSGSGSPEPWHLIGTLPNGPGTSSTAYGYFPRNVIYGHGDLAGYWASDLPSPYQDTAWSDTGLEWPVSIGSAQAVSLTAGKVYYTVTRVFDGGASSGQVKLSSQRGRFANPTTPPGVNTYGKWNSYGCSSAPNNVFTLPWNNFTAPGCRMYWYKWDISTNSSC